MSGLLLKLAPGETFIVNGALLENGDKVTRIRIKDNDARVLRCGDALRPEQVDTPVKHVYFAIQLLITGDLEEEKTLPAIFSECDKLAGVFETIDRSLIPTLVALIEDGKYYSALCHLRQILIIEAGLLAVGQANEAGREELKVA